MTSNNRIPAEESLLQTIYRHHLWSNLRLCDTLLTLTDEQLNHADPGTFGSIWATLRHLVLSEEYYLSRLTGQELANSDPESQIPIAELRERAQQSGTILIEVAMNSQPGAQVQIGEGEESELIPAAVLLLQAIHHAHEHRTQICTLLGQQGITPPALSGWSYYFEE